jgi:hypothetical protein
MNGDFIEGYHCADHVGVVVSINLPRTTATSYVITPYSPQEPPTGPVTVFFYEGDYLTTVGWESVSGSLTVSHLDADTVAGSLDVMVGKLIPNQASPEASLVSRDTLKHLTATFNVKSQDLTAPCIPHPQ